MIKKFMDLWSFLTSPLPFFTKGLKRQLDEGEPLVIPPAPPVPVSQLTTPKLKAPRPRSIPTPPATFETPTLPVVADFLKAEIHLETIGFFTPVKNRAILKKTEKVINLTHPVPATVRILPSAKYGLPVTADLDKYRAFQKILSDYAKEQGSIPQHITFTSAQLINLMGKAKRTGGEHYKDIREWLERMQLTGIEPSVNVVLGARVQHFIERTVSVFQETLHYGKKLKDGTVADRHHVWLSNWYWTNVNAFDQSEPIDYNLHKALTKPIAKALLGLLKEGFYASKGTYNKRYDQLCNLLGITIYKAHSDIERQLDPAHRELAKLGFLKPEPEGWDYAKSSDGTTYVITWTAGSRYYQEQEHQRRVYLSVLTTAP